MIGQDVLLNSLLRFYDIRMNRIATKHIESLLAAHTISFIIIIETCGAVPRYPIRNSKPNGVSSDHGVSCFLSHPSSVSQDNGSKRAQSTYYIFSNSSCHWTIYIVMWLKGVLV